ncbi:MAG: hypothetical protein ABJE95_21675 [Byssovorax sp.]
MTGFLGPHNVPNKGKIPKVTLLFRSRSRCWHGDQISLMVVTENVPDGTAVEITILPKGGGAVIDTVSGLSIKNHLVAHVYKIDWKGKPLPKTGHEFVFKAVIGKLKSDESPSFLVDITPPLLSA